MVYLPPAFTEARPEALIEHIERYDFGLLMSHGADGLIASHIPFLVTHDRDELHLHGHLARPNPQVGHLARGDEVLAIFHGPHAYISPSLYELRESVPTWNYAAVHVYGLGSAFTEEARLNQFLQELTAQFDSSYAAQWPSLSEQYRRRMVQHIVGFEINASRIETKFKLSQNRTKAEQNNVIKSLVSSSDSAAVAVATLMKDRGLALP